ncbi:hypothetical protein BDZ89DRAFT_1162746 [Hymenopellis radicata]|nr:hypothetical protein BDZ89DRAFT_1162746 [Hymenopellis radicata]
MTLHESCCWQFFLAFSFIHGVFGSYMQQSFFFDYAIPSQAVTVPVTTQCETIHIKWDRASATGPSPSAPYYLQIYTSAFVFPFVVEAGNGLSFDWEVPFAPGTLYQICMFDKNGYTGGCQAIYSMVPNTTVGFSCANASFPLAPLDIVAVVQDGPLSQYGWIPQCTSLAVTPKNGTPPYTVTVAPTLHPPVNITTNDMSTVNWTVDLSWASPFFISVVDSEFNFWSYGPLHSGEGNSGCLSGVSKESDSDISSTGKTIGTGIAGLVVGALAGILAAVWFLKRRQKRQRQEGQFVALGPSTPLDSGMDPLAPRHDPFDSPWSLTSGTRYRPVPTMPSDTSFGNYHTLSHSPQSTYQVEPFVMPGEERLSTQGPISPGSTTHGYRSPSVANDPHTSRQQSGHVYVVHHDGGRAPITVYHEDGTEVVELPPRYNDDASSAPRDHSDGRSDAPSGSDPRSSGEFRSAHGAGNNDASRASVTYLNEPRRPGGAPKKAGRS